MIADVDRFRYGKNEILGSAIQQEPACLASRLHYETLTHRNPSMHIAFTSSKPHDQVSFQSAAAELTMAADFEFLDFHLDRRSAAALAGREAVCIFVNDHADRAALEILHAGGTRLLLLRSAGYNHVDLKAARELGIQVANVPAYSPHAVAEHAVGLLLALNRKIHRAWLRVRDGNFALDGLIGFDIYGKQVGVIGTGRIGECFGRILQGFGAKVLAHDPVNRSLQGTAEYVELDRLLTTSDIISLHCPLNSATHHLINAARLAQMKPTAVLINTGRGGLIDTPALIAALKAHQIGAVGLDVYEEEADVFFEDLSQRGIDDDVLARLLTFPNVLVTAHQGFLTREALHAIALTTLNNALQWQRGDCAENCLTG